MKKISFVTIIILLGLAGCMVGPNFQKPVVKTPPRYLYDSVATDTVLNLEWWNLFRDSTLNALIDTALLRNRDVLIAASRIEEARSVVGYTKADMYPSFSYSGDGGRMRTSLPGGDAPSTFNNFSALGNVNWEIDFWGKYRRSTESARADLLAQEYGRRAVMISLIADVATNYFLLLDYHARLAVSRQTLVTRRQSLAIMEARFQHGTIPEVDLNQAQIQEAIAAAAVPLFEPRMAKTEHALKVLLGQNPGSLPLVSRLQEIRPPDTLPAGLPSQLLQRRPDILQAEQMLAAQNARIGVAQAMRFPSFSITGALGLASGELSAFVTSDAVAWSFGGGLVGPIFNFGKNKRRVEIERARTEQVRLEFEKTVLNAFREVEDALVDVYTYNKELETRSRQLVAASNASRLSRERYDGGVTSYLEVLDSERSLFDTQLILAETYQLKLNSYVKLYKALGGGWISKEEETQAQQGSQPGAPK
jgi:multidrug efflux system outer membrane protein